MRPVVLMVSKPVAPPWNDSGKNLVRDLARHGERYGYRLLTTREHASRADGPPHVRWEPLYPASGGHTPPLRQNLRVLARLLAHDDAAVRHYFFAPNPRTSLAARWVGRVRRTPSVQTVMSAPRDGHELGALVFADRVVALSEWSRRRLLDAGVFERRVVRIFPGVTLPPAPARGGDAGERARLGLPVDPAVIYAGDYEFSDAAETVARAVPRVLARAGATFVFACRLKTPAARAREAAVRRIVEEAGCAARVVFRNEVEDMPSFVGACDLALLPAESLYAKMDLPLVLLEAMARGVPVVVGDVDPLREVVGAGGGVAVPPRDAEALAAVVVRLLLDRDERRALAREARAAAENLFDARIAARRTEDLYDDLGAHR